jgi:hypothetical protein
LICNGGFAMATPLPDIATGRQLDPPAMAIEVTAMAGFP